jgi:hypothetical protein
MTHIVRLTIFKPETATFDRKTDRRTVATKVGQTTSRKECGRTVLLRPFAGSV